MASAAVAPDAASSADRSVLRDDEQGFPRALHLLAALVETTNAAAASRPAESELLRAFRGGAAGACPTPTISVTEFLHRVHGFVSLWHEIPLEGTSYVLAGIFLVRFMRSPAAREAGILIEPATAHRLVAVALFLGAKFGGGSRDTLPRRWTFVFEVSSDGAICRSEIADLEERFLRAVDFRLFVSGGQFDRFCRILELAPPPPPIRDDCCGRKRKAAEIEGEEDSQFCFRFCSFFHVYCRPLLCVYPFGRRYKSVSLVKQG